MNSTLNERQQTIVDRVHSGEGTLEGLIENRESRTYEIQRIQRSIAAERKAHWIGVSLDELEGTLAKRQGMVDDISVAIDYLFAEMDETKQIEDAYNTKFDNVKVERTLTGWFVTYEVLPEHNRIDGQLHRHTPLMFYSVVEALDYLSITGSLIGKAS